LKGVNRHAVVPSVFDLEEPEGNGKRGFISGYGAGIRHHRDTTPMSKRESDQNTGKGKHQRSSSA